jgi:uncharacterized protein VirK/YbjX
MKSVIGPGRHGSPREYAKYGLRMLWAWPWRRAYLDGLAAHPALRQLFAERPRLFHPPLSGFLDRRLSMAGRFEASMADLTQAVACFGEGALRRMAAGTTLCLSEPLPGLCVCLGLNEVNLQEGTWAISLRTAADQRLYNLSFGFLPGGCLLVASVQGTTGPGEAGLAVARDLTKAAHGLRPPNLLIEALRSACRVWGLHGLWGIDPRHHIKGRWNQRRSRLKFDYVRFWTELGGNLHADGHWHLPLHEGRRDMEDIASRKRSMYRKRFEMLDSLGDDLRWALRRLPGV